MSVILEIHLANVSEVPALPKPTPDALDSSVLTTNTEWYHEPGSCPEHLPQVENGCDDEEKDEDDGTGHRWCVLVVLESRKGIIVADRQHGCCVCRGAGVWVFVLRVLEL